jgi:ribosomal protein S6--L-glutamate ligase
MSKKFIIGREEWCSLPALGLNAIKIRVDSGAKTSALHAFNVNTFTENGKEYVKFNVHPLQNNRKIVKRCVAPIVDRRVIKSSNGEVEKRIIILSTIRLGNEAWEIEISLTNRDSMGYRMLLGREAMRNKVLVDPDASYLVSGDIDKDANSLYKNDQLRNSNALNIAVLASDPHLYSNRRLMEAGELRGHNMKFINTRYCYMNISANEPLVYYRGGEKLDKIDAVIPRIRPSLTFYGCAVVRQFQAAGAFILNDAISISRSRDKLRSMQMLADKGVNMPVTGFAHSPEDTKHLIQMVGGAPLIVKLLEGTQGMGVVLAETSKAAESVINAFKSLKANILVQEYIKEAKGKDIRCFVIDGKVVGAMERAAAEGEFRANLHLGGTAAPIKLTSEEKKMAISASKILSLKVAGVDIIRSENGPKILEVNSSPGLEGIENTTGKDIAGMMIECIEHHVLGEK